MSYCLGVDIGGTTVKLGLFKADGTLLDKWEIVTRKENAGEAILPDVAASLMSKMEEHQVTKEDVIGIGVGVPGPVSKKGIVKHTANLGWGYKEVKRELEELTGLKCTIGNDANVAALGEMWQGGGRGYNNLVMVTLGTGVGGGVIIDGEILVGTNGAAAEIGHICVNYEETDSCGCGKQGCLEQYASATGIARLARMKLDGCEEDTALKAFAVETITAKEVFDAVKEDDKIAIEIANEFGQYLGHALANVAAVVDPEIFVIGGGVSKAGDILLSFIEKNYMEKAYKSNKEAKFALATLENDAGIMGAAKLALS